MTDNLEDRIVECMRPLFGEFAVSALEQQKAKLGMGRGHLGAAEYERLASEIRAMCSQIAGPVVAERVYSGLLAIVKEKS